MTELWIKGPEDALETAHFFLAKIKELGSNIQESKREKELRHFLFAFVVSVTTIPDYVLHEYIIKYIAPTRRIENKIMKMRFLDRLDHRFIYTFCKLIENEDCVKFIDIWRKRNGELTGDKEMGMMFRVRNGAVHHKMVTNPHFLTVKNQDGIIKMTWSWGEDELEKMGETIIIPDVISFCERFFMKMKEFVDDIRKDFGY